MLQLNLQRIFSLRGITSPNKYLIRAGFSKSTVSRLLNDKVNGLNFDFLEQLCIVLKCTPNDLLNWRPDKDTELSEDHPLNTIVKKDDFQKFSQLRSKLPLNELEEVLRSIPDNGGIGK